METGRSSVALPIRTKGLCYDDFEVRLIRLTKQSVASSDYSQYRELCATEDLFQEPAY